MISGAYTSSGKAGRLFFKRTAFFVYRKPRHSGGVENSLSDEQNSLMC
jgi:hypothetical protein